MYCHKMVSDLVKIKPELEVNEQLQANTQPGFARKLKPLEEVTCYKVLFIISLKVLYAFFSNPIHSFVI